jgi:hypothetical protein
VTEEESPMAAEVTTLPLHGPIALRVRLAHGRITIATRPQPDEATVRLTPLGSRSAVDGIAVSLAGDTLNVIASRQRGRRRVDAHIEVPDGTRVTVASASAQIVVTGRIGAADVTTADGSISIDDVDGNLRLRYGRADVRVGTVSGAARISGGSGDLSISAVSEGVRARCGHGSLHVGAVYGDTDLATGSGTIDVGIPLGVAVRLDAVTGLGQVLSDLPVEQAPAGARRRVTVRARTGRGDIRLGCRETASV